MTDFDIPGSWTQPPGRFGPKQLINDIGFGPHNIFVRNGFTLNDRSMLETYWVEDMSGFDSADVLVSAQQNAQEDGELPDQGFYGGRTMTLTGWIQAGSYPVLMHMSRLLLNAFLGLDEKPMLITTTHLGFFENVPDYTINCRVADKPQLAAKIEASDVSGMLKRSFTIALRASTDPTFRMGTFGHVAHLSPSVTSDLGRIYPRVHPMLYNVSLDGRGYPTGTPGTTGSSLSIYNDGNWYAKPIIRFTGSMDNIVLFNATTGQYMYILGPIAPGQWIEVDVAKGTVVDQNGNSVQGRLDPSSDWMLLSGRATSSNGNNVITLAVSSFDSGADVRITWWDTTL